MGKIWLKSTSKLLELFLQNLIYFKIKSFKGGQCGTVGKAATFDPYISYQHFWDWVPLPLLIQLLFNVPRIQDMMSFILGFLLFLWEDTGPAQGIAGIQGLKHWMGRLSLCLTPSFYVTLFLKKSVDVFKDFKLYLIMQLFSGDAYPCWGGW